MNKVLVLGSGGQVGRALCAELGGRAEGIDFPEVDLSAPDTLEALLDSRKPTAVINAAAYTQVDAAEKEEALALAINGKAPGALAAWCAAHAVPFVHYSTDYVYSGNGTRAWSEEDSTGPLSAYGRTKLAGDLAVAQTMRGAQAPWLILRTSWVYDATGKNFVRTMLRLGAEREKLSIVDDQRGAPTYAPHLAHATLVAMEMATRDPRGLSGIYHACNSGETSWHGFAAEIFRLARARGLPLRVATLEPIATAAYPTPASRPLNSRLSCEKARAKLGITLPPWEQGLAECMELL